MHSWKYCWRQFLHVLGIEDFSERVANHVAYLLSYNWERRNSNNSGMYQLLFHVTKNQYLRYLSHLLLYWCSYFTRTFFDLKRFVTMEETCLNISTPKTYTLFYFIHFKRLYLLKHLQQRLCLLFMNLILIKTIQILNLHLIIFFLKLKV